MTVSCFSIPQWDATGEIARGYAAKMRLIRNSAIAVISSQSHLLVITKRAQKDVTDSNATRHVLANAPSRTSQHHLAKILLAQLPAPYQHPMASSRPTRKGTGVTTVVLWTQNTLLA